ncbi:MAG: hypothetical protein SVX43_17110 [Cyanobacteriota bacterium]|nr:hypothetical protein [Cyanobacteriota bacterium]
MAFEAHARNGNLPYNTRQIAILVTPLIEERHDNFMAEIAL